MSAPRFDSFEEFWPFYVREHSRRATRMLHLMGTSMALGAAALGVLTRRRWLLALAPVLGYGPAWVSHFFVERNRPATFTHPLWSLRADFKMMGKMLNGTMDSEVERVMDEQYASSRPWSAQPPSWESVPSHDGANGSNGSNGEATADTGITSDGDGQPSDPSSMN